MQWAAQTTETDSVQSTLERPTGQVLGPSGTRKSQKVMCSQSSGWFYQLWALKIIWSPKDDAEKFVTTPPSVASAQKTGVHLPVYVGWALCLLSKAHTYLKPMPK